MSAVEKRLGWRKVPPGGAISEAGSSALYKTGTWRSFRPVIDEAKCTKCLICWIYCPDMAVRRINDGVEIDYEYCKGCGICATECPVKAIRMEEE
ncbi:MAG: 4Fe-4S binding protein [Candidatus Bathyarchaeia archaeon]